MKSGLDTIQATIEGIALAGLETDGGHHKQWFLEEILRAIGYSEKDIQNDSDIWGWERGIAP